MKIGMAFMSPSVTSHPVTKSFWFRCRSFVLTRRHAGKIRSLNVIRSLSLIRAMSFLCASNEVSSENCSCFLMLFNKDFFCFTDYNLVLTQYSLHILPLCPYQHISHDSGYEFPIERFPVRALHAHNVLPLIYENQR